MILLSKLKRSQTLQELQSIATSLDLRVLPTASLPLRYNLAMDHDACDGGHGTSWDDGWDLAGHESVVGAAEGEGHAVVEIGLDADSLVRMLVVQLCGTYRGMVVGKGVVDRHVLEEPADMLAEKAFDFLVVVLRVHEDRADI